MCQTIYDFVNAKFKPTLNVYLVSESRVEYNSSLFCLYYFFITRVSECYIITYVLHKIMITLILHL